MDGVLFDTIPYAEEDFLMRHPGMTSAMYKELHAGNFHVESQKYSHLKKPETEEEKEIRNAAYSEKKSKTSMFPGIMELLKSLRTAEYKVVLNTNAFEKNAFPLLDRYEIKYMFDFIAPAELSKSKVEKFKIIEEKYNVAATDTVFITDALGDVREAEEAKVPTIAVTWGVHDATYFDKEKYSCLIGVVDTVEELEKMIKEK